MNLSPTSGCKVTSVTMALAVFALIGCTVSVDTGNPPQGRTLIDRVPASATALAWIDFQALAEATPPEKWSEYEEMFQGDEDMETFERFVEATGIDPREDMLQLAFAALPTAAEPDDYLVLMAANFDRAKLEELAAEAETMSYEGVTFYSSEDVFRTISEAVGSPVEGDDEPIAEPETPGWIGILDDQTITMGSAESMRMVVDVDGGRYDALPTNAAMTDLVADVFEEGQIWFVATRDTWDQRMDDLQQTPMLPSKAISSIENITLSLRMGDGMTLRFAGLTTSSEAANELTTSLNGLLAMGRMMVQQSEPELFRILDRALSVRQEGRTVRVQADLTEADIDALQRMAEEQMPAAAR